METRTLGKTGMIVSRLGLGLAEIGSLRVPLDVEPASELLNAALDGGITFLDTAACYGNSEELIGRTIAHRRAEYRLATKAGHVAGGYIGDPWTADTIRDSIDRSLRRMRTDYVDIMQLHSCSVDVLERGEAIQALVDARSAGKARYIGYSGDNEAAKWAIESGIFDTLQTSFNVVDQSARTALFAQAQAGGMGIIAKRPIANAIWGASEADRPYVEEYFRRAQAMSRSGGPIPEEPDDPIWLSLGFTLAHDAVDIAIVGTSRIEHMRANIALVNTAERLPATVVAELHRRFERLDADLPQRG